MPSRIANMSLSDWGRREVELAEVEMPGLMSLRSKYKGLKPLDGVCISGSLHMTIQTAVLIETLYHLGATVQWCSCNIFSTQDQAAATIVANKTAEVYAWKGETVPEYWDCTLEALTWEGKDGPDLIVDDGGDATLLIHEGVKFEKEFVQSGRLPELNSEFNEEYFNMIRIIRQTLTNDPTKWTRMARNLKGVSEETTTARQSD